VIFVVILKSIFRNLEVGHTMDFRFDRYSIFENLSFSIKLYVMFTLQLDLQLQDETGGDISSFVTNGEWDLLGK
jgi:hypothetical protein